MKKKILLLGLVVSLLLSQTAVFADASIKFDQDKSIVKVKYDTDDYTKIKVIVKKGQQKYVYNMYDGDEVFPLQMGDGSYNVKIYKNKSGNKYTPKKSASANLKLKKNQVYLQSVQNVNWNDKCKAIALAKKLSLNTIKDEEQFKNVYNEIVRTIAYDHEKARRVVSNKRYLPVIDKTIEERKGICYDYSSLMASMLRSLNIPTKLIKGYSDYTGGVYHAWNEVLLNGKWIVVDTTTDATLYKSNKNIEAAKKESKYKKAKEY